LCVFKRNDTTKKSQLYFVILLLYFVLHKTPTYCCCRVRVKSDEYEGQPLRHIVESASILLVCLHPNSLLKFIHTVCECV
jgi:hypothetical protein